MPASETHEGKSERDLLYEMHGMMSSLNQKLADHVEVDEKAWGYLKEVDERVKPLEKAHHVQGIILKVAGAVLTSGLGVGLLSWLLKLMNRSQAVLK